MEITLRTTTLAQQPAVVLTRMIECAHFGQQAVDNRFSSIVFYRILRNLEPAHRMLTAEELAQFFNHPHKPDDELRGGLRGLYRSAHPPFCR